jgi:N-acetylglucosaminyldiphosphoundecaprenol N-acetyl-beta-D-mannosaminyltransferase
MSLSRTDTPPAVTVLGVAVHTLTYESAADLVCSWAQESESRYVCASNVHMLMEAHDDPSFLAVLTEADLVTADGVPVVWVQRGSGHREASRVYGPDLMLRVCERAAAAQIPIGLFGGTTTTLERLTERLHVKIPDLDIAISLSPPFRPLTMAEDQDVIRLIHASGARILFVGLGCPKQERWMARHRPSISAVMIGVGAAFDFIAETKPQAPRWMQTCGLEWTFRIATEPRRLWWRYLYHNPRFILLCATRVLRTWRTALVTAPRG